MSAVLLARASAAYLPLRDESVQCVVTSPPYWGLRQYAGEQDKVWPDGWYGALGLEPTPEMYVAHIVEVFREVRRVLRKDGTLWLNLGDSYAAGGKGGGGSYMAERKDAAWQKRSEVNGWRPAPTGMKPKDLVGIPWMVAFALRADGWYLRSDIIWSKPNPMPESVTDRPTKAHEYLFLLSKSERYYYDHKAIKEPLTSASIQRLSQPTFDQQTGGPKDYGPDSNRSARRALVNLKGRPMPPQVSASPDQYAALTGRNKRDVWTIATQPYPGAHFATFPEALVEPCILAGSSAQACGICGAPWERMTERLGGERYATGKSAAKNGQGLATAFSGYTDGSSAPTFTTVGWRPTCAHDDGSSASVVLDIFNGSGTTGRVAVRHSRSYVGIDLSTEYLAQSRRRIDRVQQVMGL